MSLAETRTVAFGPYAFALTPEEAEAAASRFGLRSALAGGLTARHHAPLAAFVLVMLFASILALTGLVSRRAGEIAILIAAMAFMVQRLGSHWRFRTARVRAKAALALALEPHVVSVDPEGALVEAGPARQRLSYAEMVEVEDAGGLVYFWPRVGAPVVLPTRALAEGEAAQLVGQSRRWLKTAGP
jgi:hypothetical protein